MKNYDYKQTPLSRSVMSGLLAGFAAVVGNFVLDFTYRASSGFALSEIINIPSLIFASLIAGVFGGLIYFSLRNTNRRRAIYIIIFLVLTFLGVIAAFATHRTSGPENQHDFRILFGGVLVITGLCTTFLVPYFAGHDKLYT